MSLQGELISMKIMDYVKNINAGINDIVSKEKAIKIRKTLIIVGLICLILGIATIAFCFINFYLNFFGRMNNGFQQPTQNNNGLSFILFIPGSILTMAGINLLRAGLAILVTKGTSQFIDNTINHHCVCGNTITSDQMFCPKCGRPTRKVCSSCGNTLEPNDEYCRKCGTKVN